MADHDSPETPRVDGGDAAAGPRPVEPPASGDREPGSGPRPAVGPGDDGMAYPDEGDFEEGYEGPGGQQGGAQRPFGEKPPGGQQSLMGAPLRGSRGAASHVSKDGRTTRS